MYDKQREHCLEWGTGDGNRSEKAKRLAYLNEKVIMKPNYLKTVHTLIGEGKNVHFDSGC